MEEQENYDLLIESEVIDSIRKKVSLSTIPISGSTVNSSDYGFRVFVDGKFCARVTYVMLEDNKYDVNLRYDNNTIEKRIMDFDQILSWFKDPSSEYFSKTVKPILSTSAIDDWNPEKDA
jgi:hypothetical protein